MPNPEITFPGRYTPVSAVAYAKADGSTELVTPNTPMPVTLGGSATSLEPGGVAVTGTAMPTGGTGLTGWLSAIYRASVDPLPTGSNHIGNVFVDDVADNITITGSGNSSGAVVVSSPTTGFSGGTFHVTSGGTSCTVSYEQSNDGAIWAALPVVTASSAGASPATTTTAGGIFAFSTAAAFIRARISTYGSGSVNIVLALKRRGLNSTGTSLAGSSAAIGAVTVNGTINPNSGFTDSTTALASGASFTGTARASSSTQFSWFTALAFADVAGTLAVDQSIDNAATWQTVGSQAVAAGVAQQIAVRVTGAYTGSTQYRVRYVNGATAQGVFRLSSAFSAN